MADCYDLGDCFSQSFNPVVSDLNGGNLRFLDHSDGTEGAYRSYETAGAPDGQHVVVAALTWPGDPPVGSLLFDPARLAAAPVNDSEAGGPAVALAQAPRFTSAVPVAQPALEFDRDNALVMHAGRIVGGQPDDGWPHHRGLQDPLTLGQRVGRQHAGGGCVPPGSSRSDWSRSPHGSRRPAPPKTPVAAS
jgi:hypothetical protein